MCSPETVAGRSGRRGLYPVKRCPRSAAATRAPAFVSRRYYGVVAAAAALTYANSLGGEFVHDDLVAVVKNLDARGETPLWRTFVDDFWGVPMADPSSHKSYRPLTTLTFRLNALVSPENVIGYHVVNVMLHVIVSVQLAELCLRCLCWSWESSVVAAALFATHPVHTEAVSSIVGRAEMLCSVFFLLGLSLFIRSGPERSGRCLVAVCACAGCAMLAKEQGITLILVCLTYDLVCRHRNRWKERRSLQHWLQKVLDRSTLTLIAALTLIVGFRLWILQGSMPQFSEQDNPASQAPQLLTRFLTFAHLPAVNGWLLLCPLTLAYDWQLGSIPLVTSLGDPRNLATLSFYLAFLALAARLWTVPKEYDRDSLCLSLSVLLLPFLPASNLFFPVGFVVAERVLYTPSIGYCILVARGLHSLSNGYRRRTISWVLRTCTAMVLALLWLRSLQRNTDWTNRETLFKSGLISTPGNGKVHYNFANLQKDLGKTELAIEHYRIALSLWPNYVSAHNNLGTLVADPDEAEVHFRTAMHLDPNHAKAHYNLAALYRRRGNTQVALRLLNRAIELDSELEEAYALLSAMYSEKEATRRTVTRNSEPGGEPKNNSDNATRGSTERRPTRSALFYSLSGGRTTL